MSKNSSLVKLPPKFNYLGMPTGITGIRPTADHMGAELQANATLLSGENAGEVVDDVKINQIIRFTPRLPISFGRYTGLVGFNPALAELGAVSCSPVAATADEVSLVVKAYKNFKISDLEYVFSLWLID